MNRRAAIATSILAFTEHWSKASLNTLGRKKAEISCAGWHYEYKDGKKTRRHREIDVSFHMVNKITGPYYHVGVDTIDAFSFSKYKTLTEKELDKVFVDFCVSRGIPQDEKDSPAELYDGFN